MGKLDGHKWSLFEHVDQCICADADVHGASEGFVVETAPEYFLKALAALVSYIHFITLAKWSWWKWTLTGFHVIWNKKWMSISPSFATFLAESKDEWIAIAKSPNSGLDIGFCFWWIWWVIVEQYSLLPTSRLGLGSFHPPDGVQWYDLWTLTVKLWMLLSSGWKWLVGIKCSYRTQKRQCLFLKLLASEGNFNVIQLPNLRSDKKMLGISEVGRSLEANSLTIISAMFGSVEWPYWFPVQVGTHDQ